MSQQIKYPFAYKMQAVFLCGYLANPHGVRPVVQRRGHQKQKKGILWLVVSDLGHRAHGEVRLSLFFYLIFN